MTDGPCKFVREGDFVGAHGALMRTRTAEISVLADRITMLAKAVSPLPVVREREEDGETVRFSAFSDLEERYRQRYADLASNADVREIFRVRARVIAVSLSRGENKIGLTMRQQGLGALAWIEEDKKRKKAAGAAAGSAAKGGKDAAKKEKE